MMRFQKPTSPASLPARMLKAKKSVRFSDFCRVVLIPQRQEYSAAGLSASMWWSRHDYGMFKQGYLCDRQRSKSVDSLGTPTPKTVESRTMDSILVVSNSPDMTASLTAKLSSVIPKVTEFVGCRHEDINKLLAPGSHFSAVVIDGTQDMTERRENEEETPFFIDTLRQVRSLQNSAGLKITVFLDNNTIPKAPVAQPTSDPSTEKSDLMFLTADCWANFRGMLEGVEVKAKG